MTQPDTASSPLKGGEAEQVREQAARLGLIWERMIATIIDGNDPNNLAVTVDGDTAVQRAISLVGKVPDGSRVYCDKVPPQGLYVVGYMGFGAFPRVIARGLRTTASSTTTTEVGVLRIDAIPVQLNHLYEAKLATSMIYNSTILGDLIEGRLKYEFGGSAVVATLGSTQFGVLAMNSRTASSSQFTQGPLGFLPSPGNGFISVMLSVARAAGTGTIGVPSSSTYPVHMVVSDLGPDPGNTGVSV